MRADNFPPSVGQLSFASCFVSFAFAVNFETKLETFSLNNYTCCSVESDKRKSPSGRNFERGHRNFFSFFPLSVRMSSSSPVIYPIFYFLMAIEYLALATPLGQHKGEVFSLLVVHRQIGGFVLELMSWKSLFLLHQLHQSPLSSGSSPIMCRTLTHKKWITKKSRRIRILNYSLN